ncbi:hypothetical protein [Luteolibacter flavescens]|uniref:hypothetical protein n=1 Tax=Luteolibacter flavescens TaxID=1859460 RepID=UPI0022235265|nr:hypothetical protein [Luteolibacter flavescens]
MDRSTGIPYSADELESKILGRVVNIAAGTPLSRGIFIGGVLNPDITGFVPYGGELGGKPWFSSDGNFVVPEDTRHLKIHYSSGRWRISFYGSGSTGPSATWRAVPGNDPSPEFATGWEPDPASDLDSTGTPTFTAQAATSGAPYQMMCDGNFLYVVISGTGDSALWKKAPLLALNASGGGSGSAITISSGIASAEADGVTIFWPASAINPTE